MAYGECKIYNDGSHYIAIPHTTRPSRKRPKAPEEEIEVIEPTKAQEESSPSNIEGEPFELEDNVEEIGFAAFGNCQSLTNIKIPKTKLFASFQIIC